jgi:hypothetical protein
MAISTLAGARLVQNTPDAPFLSSLLPFLKSFTVFYWATGTWWIPMLLVLGVWRHLIQRFPLRYDPLYWEQYSHWECTQWQQCRWRRHLTFRSLPPCRE